MQSCFSMPSSNMAGDCKVSPQCKLNNNDCLKLSSILHAFNAALSEEQAWAVCFQTAKCIVNEWNLDSGTCYCLNDTTDILIHKDGLIHRSTVKLCSKDAGTRQLATSEYQLVATLGVIIFNALDYHLPADMERKLSRPLESLIEAMTSYYNEEGGEDEELQAADEGIEQDSGEDEDILDHHKQLYQNGKVKRGMSLVQVMELCANHLSCPEQADCHYKAVCRALVAEVLELSSFLENLSNGTQVLSYSEDVTDCTTLDKLGIQDWARLWMQVIQQLRQGVKLKKIDPSQLHHPIEYALTPYEMLLDDIRSRRYKLKQVMVNGDIPPRVKKDAHALILEFIRSRPPLVPVSKRKLPPVPPKQLTLYEKLMASIKTQHKLKPTPTVPKNTCDISLKRKIETSRTKLEDTDDTPQPQRRLIKADINFQSCSSYEELDDIPQSPTDDSLSLHSPNGVTPTSALTKSVSHTESLCSERRHSISVCESPPKSGDQTPQERFILNGHSYTSHSSRSDFWKASHWQSLECLSLTLEEVVHIRNVLTKAELESLILDPALYEDISKGKVCFTCKQIRFSFFGPWGVKCKMCERTVCDKCSSKMSIPTEHFARIPVYMLSPTPSPPPEEESSQSFWKFSVFGNSTTDDSSRPSPKLSRQKTAIENGHAKRRLNFTHSESVNVIANKKGKSSTVSATSRRRPPLQRSKTLAPTENVNINNSPTHNGKMKGPLVPVCRECKVMVCNIIMASQDKVNFEQRRRKNSRTWPNKNSRARCSWK